MSTLPLEIYSIEQIRELEKLVISEEGLTPALLMERAGQAAYEALIMMEPEVEDIAVFCGKGNNAGDGYVLARLAAEDGIGVTVYALAPVGELAETAKAAAQACHQAGVDVLPLSEAEDMVEVDIIIDAILGIGINGEVVGDALKAIEYINEADANVLSLDIPSGLDANTGSVLGDAVIANQTITFIGLKQGMVTGNAVAYCGKISCDDLGIDEDVVEQVDNSAYRIALREIENFLQPRHLDAHKSDFGQVLVVGGDYGMPGAVRMAGEAALRVGAGLVTVATRPEHIAAVVSNCPELMCYPITEAKDLQPLLKTADVIVCGPGLGQSTWSKDLFKAVLASKKPTVVDASALHLLAASPCTSDNWILTPHPGEAAALLGIDIANVQGDRYAAADALQESYHGVAVLKGAGTIVTADEMLPEVCLDGNPGMASAGMGDVLSGIIAGLLAQELSPEDAARLGVCIHANAGDRASEKGERGLLATDLLAELPGLVNPLQEKRDHELDDMLEDMLSQAALGDEEEEDYWDELDEEFDQEKVH